MARAKSDGTKKGKAAHGADNGTELKILTEELSQEENE